jgi:lipoate synthase
LAIITIVPTTVEAEEAEAEEAVVAVEDWVKCQTSSKPLLEAVRNLIQEKKLSARCSGSTSLLNLE